MSCSLSQRIKPETTLGKRLVYGYGVTDELFGLAIAQKGYVCFEYMLGAILFAAPCWALGTACGIVAGNIFPAFVVSALSVAIYGMFIAIIIPPCKNNPVILGLVIISFILSYICSVVPVISGLSEAARYILLTVVISLAAAILFPVKESGEEK